MKNIDKVMEEAIAPLKEALKKGDEESFKIFEELDDYTVRDYLKEKMYDSSRIIPHGSPDAKTGVLISKPYSGLRRLTGE